MSLPVQKALALAGQDQHPDRWILRHPRQQTRQRLHISALTAFRRRGLSKTRRARPRPRLPNRMSSVTAPSPPAGEAISSSRKAELAEHGVGVLAAFRRRAGRRRHTRHLDRRADQVDAAELRVLHREGKLQVLHLLVGEDLVHGIDRPGRHAGAVQPLHPIGAGIVQQLGLQGRVDLGAVGRARLLGRELRRLRLLRDVERFDDAAPHLVAAGRQVDDAVRRCGKRPVGTVVGWSLPTCCGTSSFMVQRVAWKSIMAIMDSSSAGMDPAALARPFPLIERDQDIRWRRTCRW